MESFALKLNDMAELRREGNYGRMRRLASQIMAATDAEQQPTRGLVRSRVLYELHMAAYQQSIKLRGGRARTALARSMRLAKESANEAAGAGDRIGVLFADMNISGLILSALDHWREALELSTRTSNEAEGIAAALETNDEDRQRAFRIAVNCYFHRGRIIVTHQLDPIDLARLREKIDANPVYQQEFKKLDEIKADIISFDEYLGL